MKRSQRVLAEACRGKCKEAQDLHRDLEESGVALDRAAEQIRSLEQRVRELEMLLTCRRGLVP